MAVTVAWDDQAQTVICVTFHQHWSWDDALTARTETVSMIEQVDHQVSLMICWDNENWMPADYQQNLLSILDDPHPSLGRVVIVRRSTLFQQFFRLVDMLYDIPFEFAHAKTVDVARQMLLPVRTPA